MSLTVAVAVIAAFVILVVYWRYHWRPTHKQWCVMLFFNARQGPDDDYSLDAKLNDVLAVLEQLPCATQDGEKQAPTWANVHVVYRAIWATPGTDPLAKVVHWKWWDLPKQVYFPPNEPPVANNLTYDLHQFFSWAYAECPADHYAVFFWGHSFGPGGLFDPGETPVVDAPPRPFVSWRGLDMRSLADVFARLVELRPRGGGGDESPVTPKVELVLMQDCWMSTLECAYSLCPSVRYLLASQSLVPSGMKQASPTTFVPIPDAIWPYRQIIDCLLTAPDYAVAALKQLHCYYDQSPDHRSPNPTVPFTLLDLGVNVGDIPTALDVPLRNLVSALSPLGMSLRSQLIEQAGAAAGRLFTFDNANKLRAGDVALVDVLVLCAYLQSQSTVGTSAQQGVISIAAKAVADALLGNGTTPAIVVDHFESADAGASLGFSGISVLYKPDSYPLDDRTLMEFVFWVYYSSLPFAQAANVPTIPSCWAKYAFEQPVGSEPACV